MQPIENLADWAGEMPAILVVPAMDAVARRMNLCALAARALYLPPAAIAILHEDGRAPRLRHPGGSGLHLSSASRAGMAALAIGRVPLGVDIELAEIGAEPPWNVLHPAERDWLSGCPEKRLGEGFARIWAGKEAYLKALGAGFRVEPDAIAVLPGDTPGAMRVVDAARPVATRIATAMVRRDGSIYAVALAELIG